jgi:16S rRNA processing protein RimM
VRVLTDYPQRFQGLEAVSLSLDAEAGVDEVDEYEVDYTRRHQDHIILKLAEIDDRDQAEELRDCYLLIPLDEAMPLAEDEYYHFQLIGLSMYTDEGRFLGKVSDFLETGANEVYVVDSPDYGELLIPAIPSVIQHINLDEGRIIITPLEGLLPDLP